MRNAIIESAHQIFSESIEYLGAQRSSTFGRERVSLERYITISLISNGREPISV